MSLKGTESRDFYFFHLPICLAMRVLPVPGGPNSRIPFTCLQPSCSIISGGNTRDAKARLKICSIVSGTRQSAQQNNQHMLAHKLFHNLRRKYLECKITPKIFVLLYQVNGRPHNRLTVTCLHPIISDGKTREP